MAMGLSKMSGQRVRFQYKLTHSDYDTVDHDTVDHDTVDHGAVDHDTVDHGAVDHDTVDHGAVDHDTVDYDTVDHDTVDHGAVATRTRYPVPWIPSRDIPYNRFMNERIVFTLLTNISHRSVCKDDYRSRASISSP